MIERIFRGCPDTPAPRGWENVDEPIAFFDRDGVLNIDHGYVSEIENFEWVDGALESIDIVRMAGMRAVVVTNQSGIGRGFYSEEDFLKLSAWMLLHAPIDAITYCPHAPEVNCPARKPGTLMLETVERALGCERTKSFLIGDKDSDLEAGHNFGVDVHLFKGGNLREFLAEKLGL